MIVEYIRYDIPAQDADAFEADYAKAGLSLDASPHCMGYELSRGLDEASCYILRIEWDSVEGHMQGFRRSGTSSSFSPPSSPG